MIYQIRANLFFNTLDIPNDLKQQLLNIWQHAQVINPLTENEEASIIEVIENHHDEHPTAPCSLLFIKTNSPTPP